MNRHGTSLAERRQRLTAQAAAQRMEVANCIEPWRTPLALADSGLSVLRFARGHPGWLAAGLVLLAVLRPRGVGKWLGRGWLVMQMTRIGH